VWRPWEGQRRMEREGDEKRRRGGEGKNTE